MTDELQVQQYERVTEVLAVRVTAGNMVSVVSWIHEFGWPARIDRNTLGERVVYAGRYGQTISVAIPVGHWLVVDGASLRAVSNKYFKTEYRHKLTRIKKELA